MAKEKIRFNDSSEETQELSQETKQTKKPSAEKSWVVKDRQYYLTQNKAPLSHIIKAADIFYFDEDKGYERELKYTKNQQTVFVDEMKGEHRLDHIIFRNGSLFVPRNKTILQQLLSLYHPMRGVLYKEKDDVQRAVTQVEDIETEVMALNAAIDMDIDMAEAIMRVEVGSKVL